MSGHSRERNKHKGRSTENFFKINCMHRNEPSIFPFGPFFGPLARRPVQEPFGRSKHKQDYSRLNKIFLILGNEK